jgi:phosphoribosylanthranilate isomerase
LAGGLNVDNVAQAIHVSNAPMVDLSSGVESERGIKDEGLMTRFVETVRAL